MGRFRNLFLTALAGVFFWGSSVAWSQDAPDVLLTRMTDDVLQIVKTDPALKAGDQKRAMEVVETRVLPLFNFQRMTQLAVGRDWAKATAQQKQDLTQEFKTLLVRTYSSALTSYKNQTVDYKPLRMQPSDTDVTVRSQINQPGGKPLAIDYSLEKQGNQWKVYDVAVAGVSLVTNYRSTFNTTVSEQGIDGLIRVLAEKNRSSAQGKK